MESKHQATLDALALAPVRDPALVEATIAEALGLRELGTRPLAELLRHYLRARWVLLVLDNAEHLLLAAPRLAALLAAAPGLGMLVTSRSPLRLQAEQVCSVAPLAAPAAVELFLQRAAQAGAVTPASASEVVGRICQRLDHLPLAIKLAAAWSHDLLTSAEQVLFRALAVFTGGWTLHAAAAVARVEEATVLELLTALLDNSLITCESQAEAPRFAMLDTIRGYATEQLHASGEHDAVRDRHTAYYHDLTLAASPTLSSPAQPDVLDSLELEHDNLRAALRRLLDVGAVEDFADACSRLWMFWTIRGHLAEAQGWADEALATGGTLPAAARAKLLLLVAGWIRYPRGQYDQAAARLAEAASSPATPRT
ncbi:MAG TPA: hypothetical protein VIY28_02245 [Pseudonocardiaceae bacterium]